MIVTKSKEPEDTEKEVGPRRTYLMKFSVRYQ